MQTYASQLRHAMSPQEACPKFETNKSASSPSGSAPPCAARHSPKVSSRPHGLWSQFGSESAWGGSRWRRELPGPPAWAVFLPLQAGGFPALDLRGLQRVLTDDLERLSERSVSSAPKDGTMLTEAPLAWAFRFRLPLGCQVTWALWHLVMYPVPANFVPSVGQCPGPNRVTS